MTTKIKMVDRSPVTSTSSRSAPKSRLGRDRARWIGM